MRSEGFEFENYSHLNPLLFNSFCINLYSSSKSFTLCALIPPVPKSIDDLDSCISLYRFLYLSLDFADTSICAYFLHFSLQYLLLGLCGVNGFPHHLQFFFLKVILCPSTSKIMLLSSILMSITFSRGI